MSLDTIHYDTNIVPDEKERLFKETMTLLRRACNLHDAIHMLDLAITPSPKIKAIYQAASLELQKERDRILRDAIIRYGRSLDL